MIESDYLKIRTLLKIAHCHPSHLASNTVQRCRRIAYRPFASSLQPRMLHHLYVRPPLLPLSLCGASTDHPRFHHHLRRHLPRVCFRPQGTPSLIAFVPQHALILSGEASSRVLLRRPRLRMLPRLLSRGFHEYNPSIGRASSSPSASSLSFALLHHHLVPLHLPPNC